jgi:hypothetical protein
MLLYFFLVIIEFIRNKPTQQPPAPECNSGQFIRTHNVKNSTIIQIRKDKEDWEGWILLSGYLIRKQLSRNDSLKRIKAIEDGKVRKNSSADQQCIVAGNITDSTIIQYIEKHHYAGPFVDQKINEDVEAVRKSRFFAEFDTARSSSALARRLVEGELSGGSDAVRSRAIAWCSRLLSRTECSLSTGSLKKFFYHCRVTFSQNKTTPLRVTFSQNIDIFDFELTLECIKKIYRQGNRAAFNIVINLM